MLYYLLLEQAASEEVDSIHFSFYSDDEIKRISVKKITKSERLDAKNHPVPGGLLDPAMGPINFPIQLQKSCILITVLSLKDQFIRKRHGVFSCVLIPISIFFSEIKSYGIACAS
jgi:hypothetical protein